MKFVLLFFTTVCLSSCFKLYNWDSNNSNYPAVQKVWGSRPVYASINTAKKILYDAHKHIIHNAGNIYAFGHFIFQVDNGLGIHVIDNSVPATADRIGFITVNGCAQISIKGNYLYTNSYADLVTLDIANPANVREVNRVANAFPEFQYYYPLSQPEESGYYTCPRYDSVVVSWVKDSIDMNCYKQ